MNNMRDYQFSWEFHDKKYTERVRAYMADYLNSNEVRARLSYIANGLMVKHGCVQTTAEDLEHIWCDVIELLPPEQNKTANCYRVVSLAVPWVPITEPELPFAKHFRATWYYIDKWYEAKFSLAPKPDETPQEWNARVLEGIRIAVAKEGMPVMADTGFDYQDYIRVSLTSSEDCTATKVIAIPIMAMSYDEYDKHLTPLLATLPDDHFIRQYVDALIVKQLQQNRNFLDALSFANDLIPDVCAHHEMHLSYMIDAHTRSTEETE